MSIQDSWYVSLLGLAESFRTSKPPCYKQCIQCLQAIFHFKPPPRVEARTHLQLGSILFYHTKNIDLARTHLEQAWMLSQSISSFDDVKYEIATILAELYCTQNVQEQCAKPLLRQAVEMSQNNPMWHCRFLFQLAQIHALERDLNSASSLLQVGAEFALNMSNAQYAGTLFILSRAMLLLSVKKAQEALPLLAQANQIFESWQGTAHQKEHVKLFMLVLQVCHLLSCGQVKTVKPFLKQLQQSVQTISQPGYPSDEEWCVASQPADQFLWLSREQLCIIVYVVSVKHSMHSGFMEKGLKYAEKALTQIQNRFSFSNSMLMPFLQYLLLEHQSLCHLVMGQRTEAIKEIGQALNLFRATPKLYPMCISQVRTLIGLYAMSMDALDYAEAQFLASLQATQDQESATFTRLNLGILYLRMRRNEDYLSCTELINPENLPSQSFCLKAAAYFVQGMQCFFQGKLNDAKRCLRETLKMANTEDLNRLTSCSLVLLGHIFLALQNGREAMNMITPAMHLASKIPDNHVQLWGSAILKELYSQLGDQVHEAEAYQMHANFAQLLLGDQSTAQRLNEHALIQWVETQIPAFVPSGPAYPSIPSGPVSGGAGPSANGGL